MLDRLRFFFFLFLNIFTLPTLFLWSLVGKRVGYYRSLWCRIQVFLSGIRFEYKGLPAPDATMYVLNHRSWIDIILTEAIITKLKHNLNPCWVAKKELMHNVFVRIFMDLYRMINVDRGGKSALIKLIKDAQKPIEDKRPIMIFPEGTRNKGGGIGEFKPGAKILAQKYGLKIQPVVYVNSDYVFDTRQMKIRRGKKIKVIFMPPVDTSAPDWFETLHADMLAVYLSEQEKSETI